MKKSGTNAAKIDCRLVNAAGKEARAKVTRAYQVLDAERKSLSATIALIAQSDAPESDVLRAALGLQKKANKAARKEVEAVVLANLRYVIKAIYVTTVGDGDEVCVTHKLLPSTSTGKERNDYLSLIREAVAAKEAWLAKKREVARLAREAKSEGKMLIVDKLPKSLQEVFTTKYHTQVVAERIIRN